MTTITIHVSGDGAGIADPDMQAAPDGRLLPVGVKITKRLWKRGVDCKLVSVGSDAIGPAWHERQAIVDVDVDVTGKQLLLVAAAIGGMFPDVVAIFDDGGTLYQRPHDAPRFLVFIPTDEVDPGGGGYDIAGHTTTFDEARDLLEQELIRRRPVLWAHIYDTVERQIVHCVTPEGVNI